MSTDWYVHRNLTQWLACGDRGLSSDSMVQHLTGIPALGRHGTDFLYEPADPDDLDRCLRLLQAVPLLRPLLPGMKTASPEWSALVDRWDEIEASHLDEVGLGWTKAKRAPRTFALMREVIRNARKPEGSTDAQP